MAKVRKVILSIETSRAWGRNLLRGVARYSRLHSPWGLYRIPEFYLFPRIQKSKKELSLLKKWDATGVITRDYEDSRELTEMGIPTVLVRDDDVDYHVPKVVSDFESTGKMAAEHLLERGFQHFAFCGYGDMYWSTARLDSFRRRIATAGFEIHVYERPWKKVARLWGTEPNEIGNWLKSLPKPVGMMTCSDDRSLHVVEACKIAKLHVPEEVAVVGVDNDEILCDLSNPPLSSVALNIEKAGYEAAELLDRMMAGEDVGQPLIFVRPTHVVTRQSTDILAINDTEVAGAVRFIRQHAKELIQVRDVVEVTSVSRRSLEQRFRQVLHRSVLDEIRRVHVEQVARMLVETNLSISQIAMALGYSGIHNIARYFKRQKNMSPVAYRKLYCGK